MQKIIFIDDDNILENSLKRKLQKIGVLFLYEKNPKKGIRIINEEKPDIIITDIIMPYINGFELIKIIKERPINCKAKIIVLTNYNGSSILKDKKFLRSLGIDKYLLKSNYTLNQLVSEIKKSYL